MQNSKKLLTMFATGIVALFALLSGTQAAAQQQDSVTDSWTVGPGDYILQDGVPDCGRHEFDAIGAAAQAIAAYRMGGIYGSLDSVLTTAVKEFQPKMSGTGGQVLDQLFGANRYANCVPVSVVIPSGARITGTRQVTDPVRRLALSDRIVRLDGRDSTRSFLPSRRLTDNHQRVSELEWR